MKTSKLKQNLRVGFVYFLLSTLVLALIFLSYLLRSASLGFMDMGGWVYYVLSCLSHASLFAAIPFLLLFLPASLLKAGPRLSGALMAVGETLVAILFVINGFVYAIYHFHINGLVVSMLTGPGASEIFVFSGWLYLKASLYILAILAVYLLLLWLAFRIARRPLTHLWRNGLLAVLAVTLLAQGFHIWGAAVMKRSVLESTNYLPYYFPLRMNSTLDRWGLIDGDQMAYVQFDDDGGEGNLSYPLHPLEVSPADTLLNIVVFGIDSWSYRTMDAETTPCIRHFADSAQNYTQHISSSNGTRGGLFGLFTGVSSYYWSSFEYDGVQPLLVSQLCSQGYQVQAYPSATFADPPFAKMFFADVEGLNTDTPGSSVYERDCEITRRFIADLDKHDSTKPFFSFVFYDLPHAIQIPKDHLYHFKPTWEYADYMELSNDDDPTPFFNLYRNCVWTVDSLIGEGLQALKQRGLLKNTVIVITGDHGQEFNENHKNYWGHWANYSRPQTGVPMVYYYPGCEPGDYNHRTTHYDISATLLKQVLGVQNPVEDISMGQMLQDPTPRDWHVVGNDLYYAFILNDGTIVEKRGAGNIVIFDKQMNQLDDYPLNARQLNDAIIRLNRFYKK